MSSNSPFLLTSQPRARWMRFDTAQILKRFFFCERSLLVSQAAWIPAVAPLDIKTGLARFIWQSAETADALRNRVFELRFPSRLLEEEGRLHVVDGDLPDVAQLEIDLKTPLFSLPLRNVHGLRSKLHMPA